MRQMVVGFRDALGTGMDPEVVDLVTGLRCIGYETILSCGGHVDRSTGGPYVVMVSKVAREIVRASSSIESRRSARQVVLAESRGLYELLQGFYRGRVIDCETPRLALQALGDDALRLTCINSSVVLGNESIPVEDREQYLDACRGEVDDLADFLKLTVSLR